jgi:hypothetical protein
MKVKPNEIVGLIEGLIESDSCMGSISDKQIVKALELVAQIKAHGIEQPSIDALISEIDGLLTECPLLNTTKLTAPKLKDILDKYRGQKK